MKSIGLFILMITLITISAKRFTRCQLAKELYMNGIPKTFISNCELIIHFMESNLK